VYEPEAAPVVQFTRAGVYDVWTWQVVEKDTFAQQVIYAPGGIDHFNLNLGGGTSISVPVAEYGSYANGGQASGTYSRYDPPDAGRYVQVSARTIVDNTPFTGPTGTPG
jgi:hypothetical protein